MPGKIKLNRTQLLFIWTMGILLGLEFISMVVLVYFARFALFFTYFLDILRFLAPLFIAGYVIFLLVMFFSKGRGLVVTSWKAYFLESLRFFLISLLLALAMLCACTLFGALISFVASQVYGVPAVHGTIEQLRAWVRCSFY